METVVSEEVAREMIRALTEEMHRHRRLRGGSVFEDDAEVAPTSEWSSGWGHPDPAPDELAELRKRVIVVTTSVADMRSIQRRFAEEMGGRIGDIEDRLHELEVGLDALRVVVNRLEEEKL